MNMKNDYRNENDNLINHLDGSVIIITGPTASGKTSVSIELCKKNDGEIVCADSMQLYKNMNIGTAKPTIQEREGVQHHLLDILEPTQTFSVADYQKMATETIKDILSRGKTPVLCGGTGQYLSAMIEGTVFIPVKTDMKLREELENIFKESGIEAIYDELQKVDPDSASILHLNDTKRILRAIEVYRLTGMTKTQMNIKSKEKGPDFKFSSFCINHDREILYDRINGRVDKMIEDGLLAEIVELLKEYPLLSNTAYQAIGYKEFFPYIKNEISLDDAINQVKQSTRNYAKRQLTWFRKMDSLIWINNKNTKEIIDIICS